MLKKTFASDNYAGVHPSIMEALLHANTGHAASYGSDEYTAAATDKFKKYFGDDIDVYFVYNGTGANVLGLQILTRSFHSILCAELAHINVDESTAPEKILGCKLIPVSAPNGKMTADAIRAKIQRIGDQHHPQAKVISLSQTTEYGTVYSIEELKSIAALAREHNLFLHMDGSRISNAAVSIKRDFADFTRDVGVDVLSFGGTKNGMMFGEAVVVFNPSVRHELKYYRKQGMQLHSKMRFISAQFDALLTDNLWKKNAEHANKMARLLEQELRQSKGVMITQSVDANGVFAILPEKVIEPLQRQSFFYVWNDRTREVRLMCAFDTSEEDVKNFGKKLRELIASV
jgi:threonine aldolase